MQERRRFLGMCGMAAAGSADLSPMLDLPGTGKDPERIDFLAMPILRGEQTIVSHGNTPWPFRNHSDLAYFDGRFWCMWSHGRRQEDFPDQHVEYSTSADGLVRAKPRTACVRLESGHEPVG